MSRLLPTTGLALVALTSASLAEAEYPNPPESRDLHRLMCLLEEKGGTSRLLEDDEAVPFSFEDDDGMQLSLVDDDGIQLSLVDDKSLPPWFEDDRTQPWLEDDGTQPWLEDDGTQPWLKDDRTYLVPPVPGGRIPTHGVLSFGYRRSATHTHQGIDIPARTGTAVIAAAAGRVVRAHWGLTPGFSGYGRVVVVRQGPEGPWLLYAHLDRVDVAVGDWVVVGGQLGTVGATCFRDEEPEAMCGGPHLHFEVSPRPYPQPAETPRTNPVSSAGGASLLVARTGATSQSAALDWDDQDDSEAVLTLLE